MPEEKPSLKASPPRRAGRWPAALWAPLTPYRLTFRILGIPIIAVAAVFIYSAIQARLVLPECDSASARRTLSDVFDQLKLTPLKFEPIKTVSSTKDEVMCNATLPLPDGGTIVADYRFYWRDGKAQMQYSVTRKAPGGA